MTGVTGLHHVQVAAPPGCEADARRFYAGVLDLPELPKPAALRDRGGVWFALGSGQALHVGVTEDFAAARKAHPALAVAGGTLAALAERLLAAGCEVRWDDAIPAVARCYVDDPWGNRLELVEQARMELVGPRKRHDAPVTLAEYDPEWAERDARAAAAIRAALGDGELHVGVEDPFRPAAKAHPALRVGSVADLEELAAALALQGKAVTWADDAEIPGQRRFHVNDPWGNRLELVADDNA